MAKKITKKEISNIPLLLAILVIVLSFALGLVSKRYFDEQMEWGSYVSYVDQTNERNEHLDSQEDATVIAQTIATLPAGRPLYQQPAQLQAYIASLNMITKRDIVVVDSKEIIVADVIPANVGKEYEHDKGEQLRETVTSGQVGHFIETSSDYPEGMTETSVPIRDANGKIVGAVILSSSDSFR